ncbi:MAG: hypothetical protein ACLFQB_14540 [Chitinispirillaceae bacterium]
MHMLNGKEKKQLKKESSPETGSSSHENYDTHTEAGDPDLPSDEDIQIMAFDENMSGLSDEEKSEEEITYFRTVILEKKRKGVRKKAS